MAIYEDGTAASKPPNQSNAVTSRVVLVDEIGDHPGRAQDDGRFGRTRPVPNHPVGETATMQCLFKPQLLQ